MIGELASHLLPGVPVYRVAAALGAAAGQELASGKFSSPQSSSALAVNGFGFFLEDPASLPAFPCLSDLDWPSLYVGIERQMRFPWSGGRHPWLDAAVETATHLIGVESKRYEPFRDTKLAKLSPKYASHRWDDGMEPWCTLRDRLLTEPSAFRHLDAAQLVKHGYGLVTKRIGEGSSRSCCTFTPSPLKVASFQLKPLPTIGARSPALPKAWLVQRSALLLVRGANGWQHFRQCCPAMLTGSLPGSIRDTSDCSRMGAHARS